MMLVSAYFTVFCLLAFNADASTIVVDRVVSLINQAVVFATVGGAGGASEKVLCAYRPHGTISWYSGHYLAPISTGPWITALIELSPATQYDVQVTLVDPDNPTNVTATSIFTTRADVPGTPSGTPFYVDAVSGDDDIGTGSTGSPFKTITKAVSMISSGNCHVIVNPGTYLEMVYINGISGTVANPCVLEAPAAGVVIDSSDPAILAKTNTWTNTGMNVYSTPITITSTSSYDDLQIIVADGNRMYHYDTTLNDLRNGAQVGVAGGFFYDSTGHVVHVKMPDGSSPAAHTLHVATKPVGVYLDTVSSWVVRGITVRYVNRVGVDVRQSSRCWIQRNAFQHTGTGLTIRRAGASENVVEKCVAYDNMVFTWPWASVKAHTGERTGFEVTEGEGNIVRENVVDGLFNGIYSGSFSDDQNEAIARAAAIYNNFITQTQDDGIEPEGAQVGVMYIDNYLHNIYNAISLSPITKGPIFIVRNTVDQYFGHAFKINNGATGIQYLYHTTGIPKPGDPDLQFMTPDLPFSGMVMRNNLVISNMYCIEMSWTGTIGMDADNDAFDCRRNSTGQWFKWLNIRYNTLADLVSAVGQEQNGIQLAKGAQTFEATPHLNNGKYTPAAGTPVVDAAVRIPGINYGFPTARISGSGPDIGSIERGWTYDIPSDMGWPDSSSTPPPLNPSGDDQHSMPKPSDHQQLSGGSSTSTFFALVSIVSCIVVF